MYAFKVVLKTNRVHVIDRWQIWRGYPWASMKRGGSPGGGGGGRGAYRGLSVAKCGVAAVPKF